MMKALAHKGIQLGQLIEYSVPHMPAYRAYTGEMEFPNSLLASQTTINLPIHADVGPRERGIDPERNEEGRFINDHSGCAAFRYFLPGFDFTLEFLPDDFLPSLGLDFLERVYYHAALVSKHAQTLVVEQQGTRSRFCDHCP